MPTSRRWAVIAARTLQALAVLAFIPTLFEDAPLLLASKEFQESASVSIFFAMSGLALWLIQDEAKDTNVRLARIEEREIAAKSQRDLSLGKIDSLHITLSSQRFPDAVMDSEAFRSLAAAYTQLQASPSGSFLREVADEMIQRLCFEFSESTKKNEYHIQILESEDWVADVLNDMLQRFVRSNGWMCTLTNASFWGRHAVGSSTEYANSNVEFCNSRNGQISRIMVVPWITDLCSIVDRSEALLAEAERALSERRSAPSHSSTEHIRVVLGDVTNRETLFQHMRDVKRMLDLNANLIAPEVYDRARFSLRIVAVKLDHYQSRHFGTSASSSTNFAFWGNGQNWTGLEGALCVAHRSIDIGAAWYPSPTEVVYTPKAHKYTKTFSQWEARAKRTARVYASAASSAGSDKAAFFENLRFFANNQELARASGSDKEAIDLYERRLSDLLERVERLRMRKVQLEHTLTIPPSTDA